MFGAPIVAEILLNQFDKSQLDQVEMRRVMQRQKKQKGEREKEAVRARESSL